MIGSRAVCQADCSGIGYKSAQAVININGDLADAPHYNNTLALPGDIGAVASGWRRTSRRIDGRRPASAAWLKPAPPRRPSGPPTRRRALPRRRCSDEVWQRPVLPQPAAIKIVADFAKEIGAAKFFDAGDVQANGFQIVEDDKHRRHLHRDRRLLHGLCGERAARRRRSPTQPRYGIAFCGDGSFMMNPQILIDGVEHGLRGMIVIFDNRRMAAITGLQLAQYGEDFRTNDRSRWTTCGWPARSPASRHCHGGDDCRACERR